MPLQPTQLDWVSFLLSASFPILLYALGALSKKGLTVGVVGLLILGVLAAGIFVVRQLNRQPPMLQMRVFATGMFIKAVFLTGISYVGLIVTTILMPLYFQTLLGLSPLISGLSLVPAAVLLSILNPISGRLLDRFGPRVVAMIGMLLITGGFGLLAVFAHHLPLIGAIMLAMATEAAMPL